MNDLKKLQPTFLQTDKDGRLFTKLTFDSYEDLALLICGLHSTVFLIGELLEDTSYNKSVEDVGEALKTYSKGFKSA